MNLLYEASRLVARSLCLLAVAWAFSTTPVLAQSGSISGKVTDAADGNPLAGANVLVIGSGGAMVTGAAATDDGTYQIESVPAGSYTLRGRFLGYQEFEQAITVSGGQRLVIDIVLSQTGFELNTVVITGSRRQEKVLDAPSSISVLTARDIESSVGSSSIEALRNTTGVDMAQTGVDRREVVLRGFNNAFSGAAYVLTDYRHSAVPSLNVNIFSIMPNMNIDVDRVEVVRGPGSALYGPGVDSGVIHFITKDPFSHPGTTISVQGGQQSLLGAQWRHAGVVGPKQNIGYKITGMYGQAKDFEVRQADLVALGDTLVDRNDDYEKINVNGSVEYRLNDKASLIANVGYSQLTAAVMSGIGNLQADGFGYTYGQVRFKYDRFFAQAYININRTGDSFVRTQDLEGDRQPDPVIDKSTLSNFQAQYDFDMGSKQNFIVGADAEFTRPKTDGTIIGRNEGETITEYGAYVQSLSRIHPKLDLTLALRGDYNNVNESFFVSPRAAIVVKPNSSHSFRVTYNRALSSPSTNSMFLDIVAAGTPWGSYVRGRGPGQGFTWERDGAGNLVSTSFLPNAMGQKYGVGAPLDKMYELVYAGIAAIPNAQLAAILQSRGLPVNEATAAGLKALLSPTVTQVSGFSQGIMGILNLTTGAPDRFVDDLVDIPALKETTTSTFEVGYKGILGPRLVMTVDAYYTRKKDFVGPLIMETPLVLPINLAADLERALTTGIANNPTLMASLQALGIPANMAAPLVAGQIMSLAGGGLPSAVGVVQAVENATTNPELMLSYRNFGDLSYYGIDTGVEFQATDEFGVFGNLSWVNKDYFDNDDLGGEVGDELRLALNASSLKGSFGVRYNAASGWSATASGRYVDRFPVLSGPYVGGIPGSATEFVDDVYTGVDSYFVLDIGGGYDFGSSVPGLRLDVSVSNLLDNEHREFVGAPYIGRMALARATYTF